MPDQIKISSSLKKAQTYIAENLEFVTDDEPLVIDFQKAQSAYVQAIRDSSGQILVEISGPESIEGEIAAAVIVKLSNLGWGMPYQPGANTPNFWRAYPEDADFGQIAKDAIQAVAIAFPEAQFALNEVDPVMSMDEALELLEQREKFYLQ